MGTFAETSIEITCKDGETAKKVFEIIGKKHRENKEDFNFDYSKLNFEFDVNGGYVYLDKSSGRIQNLEYQCEELWKLIKDIPGVEEMDAPFMIEGDGMCFSNLEDNFSK